MEASVAVPSGSLVACSPKPGRLGSQVPLSPFEAQGLRCLACLSEPGGNYVIGREVAKTAIHYPPSNKKVIRARCIMASHPKVSLRVMRGLTLACDFCHGATRLPSKDGEASARAKVHT